MQAVHKPFYLPTLDGWRAISIIMVLIYHAAWFTYGPESNSYDPHIWNYFKIGGYGVDIFFTISGYLITSRILFEYKKYGTFNIKEFYIKRFFRIVPPFYLYLIFILLMNYFFDLKIAAIDILTSISFTRIYFESHDWYTAHIWSLCVEEHFYILLSLYFFWWKRKSNWVILASLIGIFAWNVISYRFKEIPSFSEIRNHLKVVSSMDFMFAGALMAFYSQEFAGLRKSMQKIQVPMFLLLFVLFSINFSLKTIILPIYLSLLIYLTSLDPHEKIVLLLENKIIKYIGTISYSLYLWQQFFLVTQNSMNKELAFFQTFPMNIILVFVFGSLSYRYIEKPIIKFGRIFIKQTF